MLQYSNIIYYNINIYKMKENNNRMNKSKYIKGRNDR